ncbi:MAG: DUF262 domain-containing protein [Actinomycetota bacterium]|nr:DUF262 domain-containing protein [Actinomycetota bacterium]
MAERVGRLRITLCDLLKVVSITLDADDNAQVIFETLNARGTPLLALDLVKNAVFHEAARQGRDTDALYEQVWRPQLDDDYWRQLRRQGRLNRPIAELFLMNWLTMSLNRLPRSGRGQTQQPPLTRPRATRIWSFSASCSRCLGRSRDTRTRRPLRPATADVAILMETTKPIDASRRRGPRVRIVTRQWSYGGSDPGPLTGHESLACSPARACTA